MDTKSTSTGKTETDYNTPYNQLKSKLADKSFDKYVLIGQRGDNVNIIASESNEGVRDFLNKSQGSLSGEKTTQTVS